MPTSDFPAAKRKANNIFPNLPISPKETFGASGFWFLFLLTTKTLLFYAFLQLVLLKNIVFNYQDKIFICSLYMFFVLLEVYFVSKLLKNQN